MSATSTTTIAIATARQHAQTARVFAEYRFGQPAEQRRQRRLIVVPPGRVPRGDAEVELVAVVAVAVRGRDEQRSSAAATGRTRDHATGGRRRSTVRLFPRAAAGSAALQPRRGHGMCVDVGLLVAGHGDQEVLAVEGIEPGVGGRLHRCGSRTSRSRAISPKKSPGPARTIRVPASIVSSPAPTM